MHPAGALVPPAELRLTVYAALMATLIAAGAFMAIPIGPVPIVLQNFFVLLTGLLLGPRWGLTAVGVYLLAGVAGLPVFSGGQGGIGRLMGPTGGYLASYLPVVWVVGTLSHRFNRRFWGDLVAVFVGAVIVYLVGVPWLQFVTGLSWAKALAVGLMPFLIGDGVKVVVAAVVAGILKPIVK